MSEQNLHELVEELCNKPHELKWLEFKLNEGSISNDTIGEYLSALSNGACLSNELFGYLVWGVQDKTHKIIGTNFSFSTAKQGSQDLELWLRNLLFPRINFEVFEFDYNGKDIVLIRIPAAKGEPTTFRNIPYIRINSHKTDLRKHTDLMRSIYTSQEDWSAKIVKGASIKNLDTEALKLARKNFKAKNSKTSFFKEIDKWDDITFLDRAKITLDGKITNTAILLLGKDEASHYILPSIVQITWKLEGEEKAYEHFGAPLLLNTTKVLHRIRNVKYKIFPKNRLLAIEVDKYEPKVILEAIHNCIAHQDYSHNSRIIVTEKVDRLIFSNAGSFFEGTVDDYTSGKKTPEKYRNPWLVQAMVNLDMIDTLGYGIYTMFIEQRKKFFPLPDYSLSEANKVVLQIYGHIIDEKYSQLLIQRADLPLSKVILLDRVQKKFPITNEAATALKKDHLIGGRKPNFYVEYDIAAVTDNKASYIKNKAFDDEHYKKMILAFIKQYSSANRKEIEDLILDKLSNILSQKQKLNKIGNLLAALKRENKIINSGTYKKPVWVLVNADTLK